MVGIKLEQNMDCTNICKIAQSIINTYMKEYGASDNLMLVLQIQRIQDGSLNLTQNLPFSPLSSSEPS
jgi:hypothetical protein